MADDLVSIDIYPELAHEEDLTPDCGIEIDERTKQIYEACKGKEALRCAALVLSWS